jgi:hypothetical protein
VFHVEPEEVHDLGDQVVGIGKLRIRGKGSGVDVTVVSAGMLTLAEGKVIRFEEFGDRAKALAAAGLSVEGVPLTADRGAQDDVA